ncbi:MAG: nicotinate phosphoribosyltransferase [Bacteroidales bacterium]|nr:nicotinate phosphoribosyltransferase [Bacteroidales bacterium]
MSPIDINSGLYTDYYELTMAQGYFLRGKNATRANFDYFFRKNPYGGGFVVFAGLDNLLELISNYRFSDEDCRYLKSRGFNDKFIEALRTFRFRGNIHSVREGEIVFTNEPLLRVEGNIIETQLVESLILNIINFQSLIATKAARMRLVAGDRLLVDFGLRRAQGLGAIHASRAAMIGGFNGSSNTFSASRFGFESTGTMAHSWIQSFDREIDAFREYARLYPDSSILLVDTYDTLKHGVPNAITVAKELENEGHRLTGIRLDSGDLAYMSKEARKMLDSAGLKYVKIVVSNQLDEYLIKSLLDQDAPVDSFGVGTSLVTGMGEGALDGVYKLTEVDDRPSMKVSDNIAKTTLPGIKKVYRYINGEKLFYADAIELADSKVPQMIYHPHHPEKNCKLEGYSCSPLLEKVMDKGKILTCMSLDESAKYAAERLAQVAAETKRFDNPHIYKVGIGKELMDLRNNLKDKIWKR